MGDDQVDQLETEPEEDASALVQDVEVDRENEDLNATRSPAIHEEEEEESEAMAEDDMEDDEEEAVKIPTDEGNNSEEDDSQEEVTEDLANEEEDLGFEDGEESSQPESDGSAVPRRRLVGRVAVSDSEDEEGEVEESKDEESKDEEDADEGEESEEETKAMAKKRATLDLGDYSFPEDDFLDPEVIPEAEGAVCNRCIEKKKTGCRPIWYLRWKEVTVRCLGCKAARNGCSFDKEVWDIRVDPEIFRTKKTKADRKRAAAGKWISQAKADPSVIERSSRFKEYVTAGYIIISSGSEDEGRATKRPKLGPSNAFEKQKTTKTTRKRGKAKKRPRRSPTISQEEAEDVSAVQEEATSQRGDTDVLMGESSFTGLTRPSSSMAPVLSEGQTSDIKFDGLDRYHDHLKNHDLDSNGMREFLLDLRRLKKKEQERLGEIQMVFEDRFGRLDVLTRRAEKQLRDIEDAELNE